MSITTIGSYLIHYEALGRGRPLVFIHGWLGSWRYWWPSMQALSTKHRTFAFDLWGFGDSSKTQQMYSFESYVNMLEQFIQQLGISTPLTLIGHSLGATIALRYASQNPNNVEGLIAVSLPVHGRFIDERLKSLDAETFIQKVLGKANSYQEIDSEIRKTDSKAMNKLAEELEKESFADDLEKVLCKTLLVFGEEDNIIAPPSGDYKYFQRSRNKRLYIMLDGLMHFPMLQETAKFNRLLMDFIHQNDISEVAPKDLWQRRTR